MKHAHTTRIVIILIAGLIFIALFLFNCARKRTALIEKKQLVATLTNELNELKNLGLSNDDTAMRNLHERLAHAENVLRNTKECWFVRSTHAAPIRTHLQGLITLHKKMIGSYQRDLHDYRKLGVEEKSSLVKFTNRQIRRLRHKIAKFEHNLQIAERDRSAVHVKLTSLRKACDQAIAQYKHELKVAMAGPANATHTTHLKTRLNDAVRQSCEIDRLAIQ